MGQYNPWGEDRNIIYPPIASKLGAARGFVIATPIALALWALIYGLAHLL